jgi:hypothetical protein
LSGFPRDIQEKSTRIVNPGGLVARPVVERTFIVTESAEDYYGMDPSQKTKDELVNFLSGEDARRKKEAEEIIENLKYTTARTLGVNPDPSLNTQAEREIIQPTSKQLYESAYWKFVNSKTFDDADYWKAQMLSNVSMDLEPVEGFKSWVKDPEIYNNTVRPTEKKKEESNRKHKLVIAYIVAGLAGVLVPIMAILAQVFIH